jgi:hypothetical protein
LSGVVDAPGTFSPHLLVGTERFQLHGLKDQRGRIAHCVPCLPVSYRRPRKGLCLCVFELPCSTLAAVDWSGFDLAIRARPGICHHVVLSLHMASSVCCAFLRCLIFPTEVKPGKACCFAIATGFLSCFKADGPHRHAQVPAPTHHLALR